MPHLGRLRRVGRRQRVTAAVVLGLFLAGVTEALAQSAGLELLNRAPTAITDLRLASRAMGTWGKNLLSAHLSPGQQRTFGPEQQEGCLYSIRVGYSDNRFERFALVDLCRNKAYVVTARFARPIAGQNDYDVPPSSDVTIANRTSMTIRVIRMSPVGERMWGPDRLGEKLLQPGKTINATLDRNKGCLYRIYAYYEDSRVEVVPSTNLCNDSYVGFRRETLTSLDQLPPGMRVQPTRAIYLANQSGLQIDWVYVFPLNDRNRGADRLGKSVLPSGREQRLDVSDQSLCAVTVLAVYQDRREERVPSVDLCAVHEPKVTLRGPPGGPNVPNNPQQGAPSRP